MLVTSRIDVVTSFGCWCHQHIVSNFIFREMKVNEKIWKGIDEGIYKQDSEEMTLAWQEAIAEASKESLKVGIHRTPGQ